MIKLAHVEMLLAIAAAGSIRGAAKRLGRTQPAVTKALRQAEADLCAAIFTRTPSGVAPTAAGATVLRRASVIHDELRKLAEEVAGLQGTGGGRLTVTVSPLGAIRFVPAAVRRFRRRFADTHVQIAGGHEPMAFAPLREGKVDLVIGPEPLGADARGLTVEPLTETPVIVLTGAGSRWAETTRLRDLVQGEWLMIGSRERRPLSREAFIAQGLPPPEPVLHSDSIFSVLSLLQDSDYLCSFPAAVMGEIAPRWRVVQVPLVEQLPPARIAVIHAADRPLTPAGRHFCDCALAEAGYSPQEYP